ncbi:MAG TPA: OsmC family protein [Kofleriaceae bacterium]|nr:OsmC family protein [Kofleriaceae bacterium]
MKSDELRALQAPLKDRYRAEPSAARITLSARSELGEGVACRIQTGKALVEAGLHPATGGDGSQACSGDMLLEALAACYGVTMRAVATSLGLALRGGTITALGELDFRGTLGVARDARVGFENIRVVAEVDGEMSAEERATLLKLTERYCVVLQTLRSPPRLEVEAPA